MHSQNHIKFSQQHYEIEIISFNNFIGNLNNTAPQTPVMLTLTPHDTICNWTQTLKRVHTMWLL